MKLFNKWFYEKSEYDNITYCESSLARMLSTPSIPWVIITAYRKLNADGSEKTKEENIIHNLELRSKLNSIKIGVHQLVGH